MSMEEELEGSFRFNPQHTISLGYGSVQVQAL